MHKVKAVMVSALLVGALSSAADAQMLSRSRGASDALNAAGIGISNSVNNASNINVQTNISGSKQIDASSNLNVNTTINGVAVDYGWNGSNVLNVINAASADAANTHAAIQIEAQAAVQAGMLAVQLSQ